MPVMRFLATQILAAIIVLFALVPAGAMERTDINMVVALDRSESVDLTERHKQIDSLAYALQHPRFIEAIKSGYHRRIGISIITWSSFENTGLLLPWTIVETPADAAMIVQEMYEADFQRDPTKHGKQTDIALAMRTSAELLQAAPFFGARQVINIIADGIDNFGHPAVIDRDPILERGITINGLVQGRGSGIGVLQDYFRRQVIGGPMSFVLPATDRESFNKAMLKKMSMEIALLNSGM